MQARGSLVRSFVSATGGGGGRRGARGTARSEPQAETAGHGPKGVGGGARGGWWRQGTSETAGHDVRYRLSATGGLRESPTRPLRASLRVARWLNPRKKLQAQSCRLVGAAKERRGAQGDAKGREGAQEGPRHDALCLSCPSGPPSSSPPSPLVRSFRRTRCGFRRW